MWDISLWSVCTASNTFSRVKDPRHFSNFVPLMKTCCHLSGCICLSAQVCSGWLIYSTLLYVLWTPELPRFFFFPNQFVCVYVCSESFSGSLPGLRAWLREHLKPVHSGCEVWGRDGDLLKLQTMCISVPLFVCVYVFRASPSSFMCIDVLTFISGLLALYDPASITRYIFSFSLKASHFPGLHFRI